jgi:hypothetical protein
MSNTNIVRVAPTKSKFFRYWFEFLHPFHKLPPREMDVLAAFLKHRYELSKIIRDEELLDKIVFSDDVKKKVREECNIKTQHFQVVMGKLKKAGLIQGDKINKKFIPSIEEDAKEYRLIFHFDLQ